MSKADKTFKSLKSKMQKDFNKFVVNFTNNLKVRTPIDTGAARRAWRVVGNLNIGDGRTKRILSNAVGYASILDKGWSKQEPTGIVKNAFKQTKQK